MTQLRFHSFVLCMLFLAAMPLRAADASATTNAAKEEKKPLKVLCTTFPVYQITRNVAHGRDAVEVSLLLPPGTGCPHDYALTPREMRRLSGAEVLVINGLGMERFLEEAVAGANPGLPIIDASEGIDDILGYDFIAAPVEVYVDDHGHAHDEKCAHDHEENPSAASGADHAADHVHEHGEINPHLYVSPEVNAQMAHTVARHLSALDAGGTAVYAGNAEQYAANLERLAQDMRAAVATFDNPRIVEPHGAFDYLARDIGLEVVAVMQPEGKELSAAALLELLDAIREDDAGVIVTEPQFPSRTGDMLGKETGLPVVRLDPCADGPENAPLDHYAATMRKNLALLEKALRK